MLLNLLASSLLVASVGFGGVAADSSPRPYLDGNAPILREGSSGSSASSVTLTGTTWVFNESIIAPDSDLISDVDFTSNDYSLTRLSYSVSTGRVQYGGYQVYTNGEWLGGASSVWRTVTFTAEPTSSADALIAFLNANAVQDAPSMGEQIVDAIGAGLGVITALGGALVDGFDGIALDNGNLSVVVTFAFVLFGIGISVGICKKTFNWITGRHGM